MSDDCNVPKPEWTLPALYHHFNVRMAALETRIMDHIKSLRETATAQSSALERALVKADAATEKRFDSVNEFRKQLSDQTATFIPRGEHAARDKALDDRLSLMTSRINELEAQHRGMLSSRGRIDVVQIFTSASAIAAVVSVVYVIATKH